MKESLIESITYKEIIIGGIQVNDFWSYWQSFWDVSGEIHSMKETRIFPVPLDGDLYRGCVRQRRRPTICHLYTSLKVDKGFTV